MKPIKYILTAVSVAVLSGMPAMASVPSCEGANVVENEWLVTINNNDRSTREGILETLKLLSTIGFRLEDVLAFGRQPARILTISFNPDAYGSGEKASEVKNNVLSEISGIDGNRIECQGILRPLSPGVN